MKLTELFLAELDREAPRTVRALKQVLLGRDDWKLHQKSLPLARLAGLVGSMPSWISLIIEKDELVRLVRVLAMDVAHPRRFPAPFCVISRTG